jgi:tRNA threonylcarbamoyladenosine biosynthesis protein TsaE
MESIFSLEEINETAKEFIKFVGGHKVVAFHGNLGAGKTTFIQAVCRLSGVKENVSSPTFSIINQYDANGKTIYHIDLYRLQDDDEAVSAGVEECLYSGDTCFVEWPERISFLPADAAHVYIELYGNKRKLLCKLHS